MFTHACYFICITFYLKFPKLVKIICTVNAISRKTSIMELGYLRHLPDYIFCLYTSSNYLTTSKIS